MTTTLLRPPAFDQAPPVPEPSERARVLVVDDDERNLLAVKTVLEDIADIVLARSGEEALRHLLKGEFAVILMDVYMPSMDGYEAARIIRMREQTKRIPIIFLSAVNKETEHLIRGYAMGAVDYVFKPVEPIVLQSKVAVFVDLYLMRREIQRKARQEQELLDENLRANAELLRAEQELRLAEQRQLAIIQSLPLILYLEELDAEPRIPKFVSGNFQAVTGFDFDEVRDNPAMWRDRLHPEDRERVGQMLATRQHGCDLAVEYRWQCADGHYRHFLEHAVVLRDASGVPLEYAGTLLDVTDRRELELELLQVRKMDAIGKLTGGIAHDFNNLLAAVLGGLRLIGKRGPLRDEQQKIVDMTQRAAEQGAELVARLMSFSRKQKLQPAAIDVNRLAHAVTDLLTHTLGGLVELVWTTDDELWSPYADEAQLELAVLNLVINARDAMPEGGTITVSAHNRRLTTAERDVPAGDYVVLKVIDTGSGIAPDILERVTEPFFTTKAIGKGTGLGLSTVYGFSQQSGGTMRLSSEVGEGTTVELWLPRASGMAIRQMGDTDTPVARSALRRSFILLVDDHEAVRSTTAAMITDLGHEAHEVADGKQADDLFVRGDGAVVDLIITDFAMPHISGLELIRRARLHVESLPAIIVTGNIDAVEGLDLPESVLILAKPFTPLQLETAIGTALGSTAAVREKRQDTH